MIRSFFYAALLLSPLTSGAQESATSCTPTPRIPSHNYPGAANIPNSNNLLQYNGKAVPAEGQRLVVEGRLRDSRCVPIQGAIIELWQTDPFGNWRLATREDLVNPAPVFSGAGRTYSDNNGGFRFITAFPGASKTHSPHVHLRIKPPRMPEFRTQLYFENDVRNESDRDYKRLKPLERRRVELRMRPLSDDPNAGYVGEGEIILPGRIPYRTY